MTTTTLMESWFIATVPTFSTLTPRKFGATFHSSQSGTPTIIRYLLLVDGKKVPVPFNLNSLHAVFTPEYASKLEELLLKHYGFGSKVPILKLRREASGELRVLAEYIYEKVFYGYNVKQWDLTPEELSPSVTGRVPIHISRDDRYFQDRYQAIPKHGYTQMLQRMANHPNIKVLLNAEYREIEDEVRFDGMVYTGLIDEFFDYMYGELPYRSLRFEFSYHLVDTYQEVAQVNYPNEQSYTRIFRVQAHYWTTRLWHNRVYRVPHSLQTRTKFTLLSGPTRRKPKTLQPLFVGSRELEQGAIRWATR